MSIVCFLSKVLQLLHISLVFLLILSLFINRCFSLYLIKALRLRLVKLLLCHLSAKSLQRFPELIRIDSIFPRCHRNIVGYVHVDDRSLVPVLTCELLRRC